MQSGRSQTRKVAQCKIPLLRKVQTRQIHGDREQVGACRRGGAAPGVPGFLLGDERVWGMDRGGGGAERHSAERFKQEFAALRDAGVASSVWQRPQVPATGTVVPCQGSPGKLTHLLSPEAQRWKILCLLQLLMNVFKHTRKFKKYCSDIRIPLTSIPR